MNTQTDTDTDTDKHKHNTIFKVQGTGNIKTPLPKRRIAPKKKVKIPENTANKINTRFTVKHEEAEDEANARLTKYTSSQ